LRKDGQWAKIFLLKIRQFLKKFIVSSKEAFLFKVFLRHVESRVGKHSRIFQPKAKQFSAENVEMLKKCIISTENLFKTFLRTCRLQFWQPCLKNLTKIQFFGSKVGTDKIMFLQK